MLPDTNGQMLPNVLPPCYMVNDISSQKGNHMKVPRGKLQVPKVDFTCLMEIASSVMCDPDRQTHAHGAENITISANAGDNKL